MWIFGYGSLMWDGWEQAFDCKRKAPTVLYGRARSFTKASVRNWGTKAAPGPTLRIAADEGAECRGVAFEFGADKSEAVLAYLRDREHGFSEEAVQVVLLPDERVTATTFTYGGPNVINKSEDELAEMVFRARGTDGSAFEYLSRCRSDLAAVGIEDSAVESLWSAVNRLWSKRQSGIDEAQLALGDIVLTSANTLGSKAIRVATGGEFSHAMLYVGHASVVDAMPEGVHARNTQRMVFGEGIAVRVLRVKDGLSAETAKKICNFARAQVGRQYATFDAARVPMAKGKTLSRKQFCSRLIAQAYAAAGVKLVSNENYCSPSEIGTSAVLVPVEGAITPVMDKDVARWKEVPDTPQRMRDASNAFLNAARTKSAAIQDFNDVADWLKANPEDDAYFADALQRSGYLEIWKEEKSAYAWRYDRSLIDRLDPSKIDELKEYCRATASMEDGGYRFAANRVAYDCLFAMHRLKTFRAMADLYATLEELHRTRLLVARDWLRRHDADSSNDALIGRLLEPHSEEWFDALAFLNRDQAEHTREILNQSERIDVCSVCGDDPAHDYAAPLIATPSGATMSLRLCEDCANIRLSAGEDLVPVEGSAAVR